MNKWMMFVAAMVLVGLPLVVYQPSLHGGFLWDDDAHVTRNAFVHSPQGLSSIWATPGATPQYYPVTFTGFWLQYQLWGDWAMGYRLVNVLLHGLSCLLVWLILRRLKVPGAYLVAAIFAVHPVYTETVAWISELKNILSGVFYLTAVLAYFQFTGPLDQPCGPRKTRQWCWYGLTAVLFLLALLSKTVTATWPAVMLLLLWWKRPRLTLRDIWPLVPLLLLGVCMGLMTVFMEKHQIGAKGPDFDFSPVDRVLIAGRALWFYVGKMLWPHPLVFFYPRWDINPMALWQYLYPLAALGVMGLLLGLHRRIGKAPAVAVLFFAGTLVPALGFFDVFPFVYSFVADHFQYLASLGIVALVVGAGTLLARRLGHAGQIGGVVVALLLVGLLGGATWQHSKAYRSGEALYLDVIAKNPRAWMARNNLANLYIKENRWDEAAAAVAASLQIKPGNDRAQNTQAVVDTHFGRIKQAIEHYRQSMRIRPDDPYTMVALAVLLIQQKQVQEAQQLLNKALLIQGDLPGAYTGLGDLYLERGELTEAAEMYRHALTLDPLWANAQAGLGQLMEIRGKTSEAIHYYTAALEIDPHLAMVHNNLARLLAQKGQFTQAIKHFYQAVQEDPKLLAARQNLALTLIHQGKTREAMEQYEAILQQSPNDIAALTAVADQHVSTNELAQAIAGYQKVIQLAPDNAQAQNNLGVAYMLKRQDAEAFAHIQSALKLDPRLVDGWFNLGLLNFQYNRLKAAGADFDQVIHLEPDNAPAIFQRGRLYELAHDDTRAVAMYRRAMQLMPKDPQVKLRLAWVLATTTGPGLRSPEEALTLASEALKRLRPRDAASMDTLAVAQAASGLYPQAVASARQAIKLARAAGQEELAQLIEQRVKMYQAREPFVAPSLKEPATAPTSAPATPASGAPGP